jgi:uncharacterized membrane protein
MNARAIYLAACASLIALIFLCLAWEIWLAPLRDGGSWLVLKVLPLLAPLIGVLRGRVYTHQWSLLLVLGYFIEGVVRAWSETGAAAWLAQIEIALAAAFFSARSPTCGLPVAAVESLHRQPAKMSTREGTWTCR